MKETHGEIKELSQTEPLSKVASNLAELSPSPTPPSQPQSLASLSQPQRPSSASRRRRSPLKRSRSLKAVPDESQEMMDHQDDIDIPCAQRRAGPNNQPPQSPQSGLGMFTLCSLITPHPSQPHPIAHHPLLSSVHLLSASPSCLSLSIVC